MDQISQQTEKSDKLSQQTEKTKKANLLISLLYSKKLDIQHLKELFLENYASVPQEHRLIFWKLLLGISNSLQTQYSTSGDSILSSHYTYIRHIIKDVLEIKCTYEEEFNYCCYLLDKDSLPLDNSNILTESQPFCLIYRQMNEILDDPNDFERFYLTTDLYEYLKKNLYLMQEQFDRHIQKELVNKPLIKQINIKMFLLTGLAGLFKDIKIYHIIWDRLIMTENDLMIFTLVSFFENCKEDHLKQIKNINDILKINTVQKFGLDEAKILKTATKYYRNFHSNPLMPQLIINYFNSK